MKKKIIGLVILLALITAGAAYYSLRPKANPDELTLYGNVEIRQVDMSFQVAGQVKKMLKEEGDKVKKGELLAILDDRDYRANLEKAAADVDMTLAQQKEAVANLKRNKPLGEVGAVSEKTVETMENTKDSAIASHKLAIAQKKAAKNQLDYTRIYAPDNGIVMVRVVEPGATVNKGQSVYTISKTKPVWIRAYVNETDLGNIAYGMGVKVYTDTTNPQTGKKREYNGYIGYISPVAEFTPKTVQSTDLRTSLVYRIRVYIDDVDEFLRQGMPVTIKIELKAPSPQPSPSMGEGEAR